MSSTINNIEVVPPVLEGPLSIYRERCLLDRPVAYESIATHFNESCLLNPNLEISLPFVTDRYANFPALRLWPYKRVVEKRTPVVILSLASIKNDTAIDLYSQFNKYASCIYITKSDFLTPVCDKIRDLKIINKNHINEITEISNLVGIGFADLIHLEIKHDPINKTVLIL